MFAATPKHPVLTRALTAALFATALPLAWSGAAHASSHREAPFISTQPQVDGTDFYMFRSYETGRDQYAVLIANYLPLQDAYGGPNYFKLDPNAFYEIHVVNDGGAVENITFRFQFTNTLDDNALIIGGKKISIPLVQNGSADVASVNSSALNVHESYTVNVIYGPEAGGTPLPATNLTLGGTTFPKPVDYIGTKTISNYIAYANKHIWDISIPNCSVPGRVFVGQRKDPFVVNLGETFDLVNFKYPATEFNPLAEFATTDKLADANVTAIILEAPIACLTQGKGNIIGAWTTASLPANRALVAPTQGLDSAQQSSGAMVQVSRLGMPLVNELVIGLKDKNNFNNSQPKDDAQFADYVTHPSFAALLEVLFGSAGVKAPTNIPRTDLVATFLTGIQGLNQPPNVTASEMLRLNTSIPPTPFGSQNRLGVLGGDNAGFPNGRRPADDVVDIELRVVIGVLCTLNIGGCQPSDAPAGTVHLTDGAFISDQFFHNVFPYLHAPLKGSPNDDNAIAASKR